jgi:hypothetical protein
MLKCQFSDTEIRASLPASEKLLVEVRGIIFKEALEGCWNAKAPGLLVALRGHRGLYFEALALFKKGNTFKLNFDNCFAFKQVSDLVLDDISNLEIELVQAGYLKYPY